MSELKDIIVNVWKFNGKKVKIVEKISGAFMWP